MKRLKELNEDISALLKISTVPMKESVQSETSFKIQENNAYKQETSVFIQPSFQDNFDLVKEKTKLDLKVKIAFLEREINPLSLFSNETKVADQKTLKLLEILKIELQNLGRD